MLAVQRAKWYLLLPGQMVVRPAAEDHLFVADRHDTDLFRGGRVRDDAEVDLVVEHRFLNLRGPLVFETHLGLGIQAHELADALGHVV